MARQLFTGKAFGTLDPQAGLENRSKLSNLLSTQNCYFMKQTHSNTVHVVTSESEIIREGDGLVTKERSMPLAVQVGDCLPLLLESEHVIAAVHVGRKGLLNGVAVTAVSKMKELGASKISGVVGPHICANCYEVDEEMFTEITKTHPESRSSGRKLNLFAALAAQIPEVPLKNLQLCTLENQDYFSFRRGAESGRQVGVICL
jgi:YfiH family protein